MKSKYIILSSYGMEVPVVFSPILQHDEVAAGKRVIAAGFCVYENNTWRAWGKSVSLNIPSRPEDAEILNRTLCLDI